MVLGFIALLAGTLGAPLLLPPMAEQSFSLHVAPRSRGSVRILSDALTVAVDISDPPPDLEKQMHAVKGATSSVLYSPPGENKKSSDARVYMRPGPISGPDLVQITDARLNRRGDSFEVQLKVQNRQQATEGRTLRNLPQVEAAGEGAKQLRNAEAPLLARDFEEAIERFTDLKSVYVLRPWVALRLADITLWRSDVQTACMSYRNVRRAHSDRAAGMIATLRLYGLGCLKPREVEEIDWPTLLRRYQADDLASRWLADEARWALTWSSDRALVDGVTAYGENLLGKPQFNSLLTRVLDSGSAIESISSAQDYDPYVTNHPEAGDLRVWEVMAYCNLELPRQAVKIATRYAKTRNGQPWLAAASRCATDTPKTSGKAVQEGNKLAQSLDSLEARMRAVRAAVDAQESSP